MSIIVVFKNKDSLISEGNNLSYCLIEAFAYAEEHGTEIEYYDET